MAVHRAIQQDKEAVVASATTCSGWPDSSVKTDPTALSNLHQNRSKSREGAEKENRHQQGDSKGVKLAGKPSSSSSSKQHQNRRASCSHMRRRMRPGLCFSSQQLEAQYKQHRLQELAKSDLIKLPLACLMNLMLLVVMLGSRRGVGATLAHSGVLVLHAACLMLLPPATYAKHKPVISSLCRLGWHTTVIWALPEWIQPIIDTLSGFIKLLMASGILALNGLLPFTLTGSLATDILLQLAAAPYYVVWFAPNHTCRHIVAAPSQLSCLERLWGGINSMTASFAQVLMLPLLPTSFSKFTPMQACVQAVVMLQLLLGVALPCIGLVLAESAARRRFLSSVWQQQGWTALQHVMLLEDSVSGGTPGTTSPQQQQEEGESSTSRAGSAAAQAGDAGGSSPSSHSSSMSSMAALDGAGVPLDSPADFHINLPGVIACLLVLVVGAWQLLQDVSVWVGLGLPA